MGTLWKIAARNVARHRRRTVITALVMAVGIAIFIMFDSMLTGMDRLTIDNMVAYDESFMKLRTPEYVDNLQGSPLDYGLPAPEAAIRAVLAAHPSVKAATPRTRFVARVSNYVDEVPVLAVAVDPARDGEVYNLRSDIAAGVWLDEAEPGSVVMGAGLAAELGLSVGDYALAAANTVYDNANADEYLVAGILSTPIPNINSGGLFMSYADADELLGLGGLVTEIDVASGAYPDLATLLATSDEAAASVRSALPGLRVDSIDDMAQPYLAMRTMKSKFSYIMILVVLLIAAVGIVNTILMSVYARIREIGVLKAYGMPRAHIRRLFTMEGVIIGAIGSTAGVMLGAAVVWYLVESGIPIKSMIGDLDFGSIPLGDALYGVWNPATMAAGWVFGVAVSFVAARIPASKAARLEAVDALHFA